MITTNLIAPKAIKTPARRQFDANLDDFLLFDFPQRHTQLVNHLHPIRILQNRFAQKGGLGWGPEGGFGEAEIAVQRGVAGYEVLDGIIVIWQPKLGEEV